MPIIKSSSAGDDITVVVFTDSEINALVQLLENVSYPNNKGLSELVSELDELFYGLNIRTPDVCD